MDVLDLGAAPAVDRLVVVTYHHQARRLAGDQAQPGVLHGVGVLKLVHQHVTEACLILLAQGVVVAPELQRAQQQLGKVDHAGAGAGLLVALVDPQHGGQKQVAGRLDILRAQTLVLLAVDPPLGLTWRPLILIQAELTDHPLDQTHLVVAVENLELLGQTGLAPMGAQQAVGQTVEGPDPHALRRNAEQLLDPVTHLMGSLVGKGDRENAPGRGLLYLHQPGNTVNQHPGLAGAGTGQHQLLTGLGSYGLALGVIERIEQM